MRGSVALLLGLAMLAGAAGCRSCDLLEAELRSRESAMNELRCELARADAHNDALQREVCALRSGSAAKISPEFASQTYTIKQIVLARQTGGYDEDGVPGDEALQVVLEPRDADGHAIKAPGTLHVEALEISPEGLKRPLSAWDVPPEKLRQSWRNGLFSTGYYIVLPWKACPSTERVRVVAQLTLADGRVFEADKDVAIHPMTMPNRKADPNGCPIAPPETPSPFDGEVLPLPRKVDPVPPPATSGPSLTPATVTTSLKPAATVWRPAAPRPLPEAVRLLPPVPVSLVPEGEGAP
jgi:hypothetical protein